MTEPLSFKYRAFLSYSHRDTAWGKWLHGALEGYRIDRDLVGRETPAGPVPRALRPIFRDREDFSAGHSLSDQTRAALETSQFLVVVCSPNAARSQYVNEEIRRYKAFGRGGHVIPIIVDGEPGDPERECFPPALRFKVRADGDLTEEREEPIAADARPQGDGKDIALLKLVAGLLGVGLDEIARRAERARRQRLRNWVAALAVLTWTFAGLAVWAEINRREADLQRRHAVTSLNAATRTSNELIFDLAVRFRNQAGVPSELVKDLLGRAHKLQAELTASGQTSPDLQHSQASVILEMALTLYGVGDREGSFSAANRAKDILEGLLAASPRNANLQLDLGVAYQRLGDTFARAGQTDQALAAYDKARALQEALVEANSSNDKARQNLAVVLVGIGDVLAAQQKIDAALAAYQRSVKIAQELVERDGRNASWLRDLGIGHERVGIILAQQRKFDEALAAFEQRLAIAQMLADDDPNNTQHQRNLAVAHNKVGDTMRALDRPDDALSAYRRAFAIREKLVAVDRANANWLRDLAISHNLIGIVLALQGKIDDALASFQQGLAIGEKLVALDRNVIDWQSDLYLTNMFIGRLLAEKGSLDAAQKRVRTGLAIAVEQAKAHPNNIEWQNHLRRGAIELGALAYRFILARQFAQALDVVGEAVPLAPEMILLHGYRAPAFMLLDRPDEAKALYLQYRDRKNVRNGRPWTEIVLGDFAQLRKAGLAHPLMDEVEKEFKGR